MSASPVTAVLLIAHGSRHAEANEDTHALARALARDGHFPVVVGVFLEMSEPNIDAGASNCVEQGAERIILLPHFLSAGVHVQRDLTVARQRLAERFPTVEFRLAQPIGCHPDLLKILSERAREACG